MKSKSRCRNNALCNVSRGFESTLPSSQITPRACHCATCRDRNLASKNVSCLPTPAPLTEMQTSHLPPRASTNSGRTSSRSLRVVFGKAHSVCAPIVVESLGPAVVDHHTRDLSR